MKFSRVVLIAMAATVIGFSGAASAGKGSGGGGGGGSMGSMGGMSGMGGVDAPKPMVQEEHRYRNELGTAEQKGELTRERVEKQLQGDVQGIEGGPKAMQ